MKTAFAVLLSLFAVDAQTISTVSPTIVAGSTGNILRVTGSHFAANCWVTWNGEGLLTKLVSPKELTAQVPDARIATPTTATVAVACSTSNAFTVGVVEPPPAVTPTMLTVEQVQGGPRAAAQTLHFTAPWSAAVSPGAEWLTLGKLGGAAADPLAVGLVDWRAISMQAGSYTATITASVGGRALAVPVSFRIVPALALAPAGYIAAGAPKECATPSGYLDAALCNFPADTFAPDKGATFVDPFGGNVRILTEPNVHHTYSEPSPLSATSKYILVFKLNGFFDVRSVADGSTVTANVATNQSTVWDANDDNAFYFVSGSQVIRHDVAANTNAVYVDYAPAMTHLERGGTGEGSADNWFSFFDRAAAKVCALDVGAKQTYCGDTAGVEGGAIPNVDFSLISKGVDSTSGKRYVILAGAPSNVVYTVNLETKRLDFAYRGPLLPDGRRSWFSSHSATMQDANGIQYVVFNDYSDSPGTFDINTVMLNKGARLYEQVELGGGRKRVFTLFRPGPDWTDEHVGCSRKAPYCVISTQMRARASTDPSPIVRTAHDNEIILMTGNGDRITRVTKSHTIKFSDQGDANYWGIPRAAISSDGALIVFDSNYGTTSGSRVSIVPTR